jgi:hypothetical protein
MLPANTMAYATFKRLGVLSASAAATTALVLWS